MMRIPSCHMEIEQVFLQTEQSECRSICITSTNQGEGVSSLALALTERHLLAGYRTLLVDLNLQHPTLSALTLPQRDTNKNKKKGKEHSNPVHYLTAIQNSAQVISGVPSPTKTSEIIELRQPKKLKLQIEAWLTDFDKVIIDSSALSQLNANHIPAQTVAGCCDGTIMIVLSGQTLQTEFKEALLSLETNKANLLGHVFNDQYQPCLKNEICREIERLRFLPNQLSTKLISIVQQSRFLSTVV